MGRKIQYVDDKEWLVGFGERFRQLRKHLKLSQAKMAIQLDITPQRISQIESGDYPIGILLFNLVCCTFNVDPRFLLGMEIKQTKEIIRESRHSRSAA